jgi:hypothetical protein
MRNGMVWAGLALAALAVRVEGQGQAVGGGGSGSGGSAATGSAQGGRSARTPPPAGPSSGAFDQACVDLLHGRMPQGDQAIKTLRDACANLMSGRVDERVQAEQRRKQQIAAQEQLRLQAQGVQAPTPRAQGGQVQPGAATAQPEAGEGVVAAFGSAASELTGGPRQKGLGMRGPGRPVNYMIVTNPVGWFNGLGVNAELFGALQSAPMFSWIAGARYSGTDTSNGTATTFGLEAGFDWFIIGQHNEGLRLGPRMELAAGRQHITSSNSSTTFARLGLGGEVGYNFIATNGISGLAAVGLGGRVAGDNSNQNFASFVGGEFGPYAKIGLGFGW